MNRSLIDSFLADQRKAKAVVAERLNIPQDIPAVEWSLRHHEIRDAYAARPFAEIFRPHGFGLELKIEDLYIDYDYSEYGLADGFDAWRLYVYLTKGESQQNDPDLELDDRIDLWFKELIDSGQIIKGDNLYYLANRNPFTARPVIE